MGLRLFCYILLPPLLLIIGGNDTQRKAMTYDEIQQRTDHAEVILQMAFDMLDAMQEFTSISNGEKIQLRIGIHCGEVVAGVIGKKKFSFDLWGDAVNTAARMESHGEAGKVHVSEEFMSAIVPFLSHGEKVSEGQIMVIERGEIEVKGKGIMKTYF